MCWVRCKARKASHSIRKSHLKVRMLPSPGCPRPLPLASNPEQDPKLKTIMSHLKWQENNHLAVSGGHSLPSMYSAGDSPHTVLDWRFLGLTPQLKKTRGLTNSFTFPCCMGLVTCRSNSSCFSGEVRRGCCRIGNTLSILILYGTICVVPKSPSERDNTCWQLISNSSSLSASR